MATSLPWSGLLLCRSNVAPDSISSVNYRYCGKAKISISKYFSFTKGLTDI